MKLKGKAKKIDQLHIEYENLLIQEIESLIGIAAVHGWKSRLYQQGLMARNALRQHGSQIPRESE